MVVSASSIRTRMEISSVRSLDDGSSRKLIVLHEQSLAQRQGSDEKAAIRPSADEPRRDQTECDGRAPGDEPSPTSPTHRVHVEHARVVSGIPERQ